MLVVVGFTMGFILALSGFSLDAAAQEKLVKSVYPQRADLNQMESLISDISRGSPALQRRVDIERKKTVVIFIPGILASKLKDPRSGKVIWGENTSVGSLRLTPETPPADAPEILGEYWKDYYVMKQKLAGLLRDEDLILWFPYDWRQDIEWVAEQLDKRIRTDWRKTLEDRRVIIIAHSMGGLIAWTWKNRLYRKEAYDFDLFRLILLGTPLEGSCETLLMLLLGYQLAPSARIDEQLGYHLFGWKALFEKLRPAAYTFPSVLQLLPRSDRRDPQDSCLVAHRPNEGLTALDHFNTTVWKEYLATALKGYGTSTRYTLGLFSSTFAKRPVWHELGMSEEDFWQHFSGVLKKGREFRNTLELSEEPLSKTEHREGRIRYLFSKKHPTTFQAVIKGDVASPDIREDGDGRVMEASATNGNRFTETPIPLDLTHSELVKDDNFITWLGKDLERRVVQERLKDSIATMWKDEEGRRGLISRGTMLGLSDLDVNPLRVIDDDRIKAVLELNAEVLRQATRKIRPELASEELQTQAYRFAEYLLTKPSQARVAVPFYEVALSTRKLSGELTNYAIVNYSSALLQDKKYEMAREVLRISGPTLAVDWNLKPYYWNNLGVAYVGTGNVDAARLVYQWAADSGLETAKENLLGLDVN